MSKKPDLADDPKGPKPSSIGVWVRGYVGISLTLLIHSVFQASRNHKAEERPATPTVGASTVSSPSKTPNVPLRRVVSNPTSQSISPDDVQSRFTPLKSPPAPAGHSQIPEKRGWKEGRMEIKKKRVRRRRILLRPAGNQALGWKIRVLGLD
jgi:hypothetical protein